MALPICPRCGRQGAQEGAMFCPFCGAQLSKPEAAQVPAGAQALLDRAAALENNKKKLALLRRAREEYPDCLAVEEEWLFQGNLPEKGSLVLDFSRIKCYLLHLYLTPDAFDAARQAAMRQELFHHPQLLRCLSLAPSADEYMAHYLGRLCREFIQVFLKGSSEYMPRLMGFQLERNPARVLARPVAQMMRNIEADEALGEEERSPLCAALRLAFGAECGGEMRWLLQELGE